MIIGIDTSCYTTSLAIVNSQQQLVYEKRQLLKVDEGERGLQQSKALFQHLGNFPALAEAAFKEIDPSYIKAVCISEKPRPEENSYMPVFTAGINLGKVLAVTLKVPLLFTSHQEGHIEAGLWSAGARLEGQFIAVHLSGGTTEVLKVTQRELGYKIEKIGGTTDLHAGQFVDRVGVALGLSFPAGPALEQLATQSANRLRIPSSVKGYDLSFSGPETTAQRMINAKEKAEDVARAVEQNIVSAIEKVVRRVIESFGLKEILIVGGVAANKYLRSRLEERLGHRAVGAKLYFAKPQYSTDNAVGVALLGWKKHQN